MRFIQHLPNALTLSRFAIALALVGDALDGQASPFFLFLFFSGALTDFLDGFLARKWDLVTARGAVWDGYADIVFAFSVLAASFLLFPELIRKHLFVILAIIFLQALSWGYSYFKFRRITSYHTYSAKLWGVMLFVSLSALFVFSTDRLLPVMFIVAGVSIMEDLFITAVLPCWTTDIKYFTLALKVRQE